MLTGCSSAEPVSSSTSRLSYKIFWQNLPTIFGIITIKIQAQPEFINQLRIFGWGQNLQVDWYSFMDYCRFSRIATIVVDCMTIYSLKTSSGTMETLEWQITKPSNEPLPDELIYIMNLKRFDLNDLTKIKKDKLSGQIYGTYCKKLN